MRLCPASIIFLNLLQDYKFWHESKIPKPVNPFGLLQIGRFILQVRPESLLEICRSPNIIEIAVSGIFQSVDVYFFHNNKPLPPTLKFYAL